MSKKNKKTRISSDEIPRNGRATFKRLWARLSQQRSRLLLILLMTLLSSAAYAVIPLLLGRAIDSLLAVLQQPPEGAALIPLLKDTLLLPSCLLALAALGGGLLSYAEQYLVASVGETLTLGLREEISSKLSRLPLRYYDKHQAGEVMSRVSTDLDKVAAVIQTSLMQFVAAGFTILFTFAAMLYLSPQLFGITALALLLCFTATFFVSVWSQRCYAASMVKNGELSAKIEESYSGSRVLKLFSQEERSCEEVVALGEAQFKASRAAQFADYAIYPSIRLINQLGFVAVAVVSGGATIAGGITLGAAQAFLQYYNQVGEPITTLSYVITATQAAIAGAERVFDLLDAEEEPQAVLQTQISPATGRVDFEHVHFGYTKDKPLIVDLNLAVAPQEMIAIVGPTGAGKTTLINLLMRFYELDSGRILVDGQDISSIPRGELRRKIGMVLQDTWLFAGTIAENLSYGKQDATRAEIVEAAKAACCDHFIRTLPQGYDTLIAGESSQLSQGQLQLLTIARAMLNKPSLLILDEASSSVDTRTEQELQKAMARLMQGKTCFVIAHRLSTIQGADRILVVRDGSIVEQGKHAELLQENGFYAQLYRSQFAD